MFSPVPMWNITRENMRRMRAVLENGCTKGWWGNSPNQGTGRQWLKGIVDIGNQHGDSVRQQIEEMMHPYLDFIKSQYPHLRYWRVRALLMEPNANSQYEKFGDQLHSDYSEEVTKQDPPKHPMLMIMALDEDFEFLCKDKDDDDEDDNFDEDNICGLTVRKGHAIAFTNELFHAGGANNTGKPIYPLFAYIVSKEEDYPNNRVFTKNRSNIIKLTVARRRAEGGGWIGKTGGGKGCNPYAYMEEYISVEIASTPWCEYLWKMVQSKLHLF
jgi:hypothetical protein